MPRLRYIEESEKTPYTRELIESAKRTGAPDPRVVSLMTRGKLGIAWVEYWNKLLYQGVLPHKLKEMCRIKISVACVTPRGRLRASKVCARLSRSTATCSYRPSTSGLRRQTAITSQSARVRRWRRRFRPTTPVAPAISAFLRSGIGGRLPF